MERKINLKDGKTYTLHFWATWCKPCISEFDEFEKYKSKLGDQEFLFISLEDPKKVQDFLKDKT
ncbi:TlpA family protein disulfide reductase [Flavobacterium sp.]|uniref:TlpA family protein disulfide reductase n=1 Tax=Flavobacterium sp. TaxID=239 RepID=UPI003B9D4EC8